MAAMHKATCTRPGCGLACSSASVDEVLAWSEAHDQHCPSLKAQGIAPRLLADAEKRGAVKALRDIGGTLLALGYADAEAHVIRHADRIESVEVTR